MSRHIKPQAFLPLISVSRIKLPTGKKQLPGHQRGAALIAVIFVITALAALGGLMTQLMVLGSEESIDEWYSTQALYAAESGVEWSIYNGGTASSNQVVTSGSAWFDVSVTPTSFGGGKVLYVITSTGKSGGSAASPRTQRQIVVRYMP